MNRMPGPQGIYDCGRREGSALANCHCMRGLTHSCAIEYKQANHLERKFADLKNSRHRNDKDVMLPVETKGPDFPQADIAWI